MNRILGSFYKAQFEEFRTHVSSLWAVEQKHLTSVEEPLKEIHKRYLSLACAATIAGQGAPRRVHIEVVPEVCHLSVVLAIKGLENTACILLRQSIELVLKHVFFATHPVEFGWTNSREGYKELTFQKLIEYIARTEELRNLGAGAEICQRLNDSFGVLSRYVHAHSKTFIGHDAIRAGYKPKSSIITKLNDRTREIWPLLTVILIAHFVGRYLNGYSDEVGRLP